MAEGQERSEFNVTNPHNQKGLAQLTQNELFAQIRKVPRVAYLPAIAVHGRVWVVSWLKRFDEPIVLEDGTTLRTLRNAIQHVAKTQKHDKVTNRGRSPDTVSRAELSDVLRSRGYATDNPSKQI